MGVNAIATLLPEHQVVLVASVTDADADTLGILKKEVAKKASRPGIAFAWMTHDLMGTAAGAAIRDTLQAVAPRVKRVHFIHDVTGRTLRQGRETWAPHFRAGTAGHELPGFNPQTPCTWIPHPGLEWDINPSPAPKALVPQKHALAPLHKRGFYALRHVASNALRRGVPASQLDFQTKTRQGGQFFKLLGAYLVNVVAVPSDDNPYLVNKFWQTLSVGALLVGVLTPKTQTLLESVGLRDGVHFVAATPDTVVSKVLWALNPRNRRRVDAMRRFGHAAVADAHLPRHRLERIKACMEYWISLSPPSPTCHSHPAGTPGPEPSSTG